MRTFGSKANSILRSAIKKPRRGSCLGITLVCCLSLLLTEPLLGQLGLLKRDKTPTTQFVPDSAFAAVTLFPKSLAENPMFDSLPREIATAWGLKELGFDPMLIEQATVVVDQMQVPGATPAWGVILHFEEMQGLGGATIAKLQQRQIGGKTAFIGSLMQGGPPSFLVYDEATIFLGDENFFEAMMKGDSKGRVAGLMKSASVKGQIKAVVDMKSSRELIGEMVSQLPRMLPPPITKLARLQTKIDSIEIGIDLENRFNIEVLYRSETEEDAEEIQKAITDAVEFGGDMAVGALASQMDFDDPVQEALVDYAQRIKEMYQGKLTPQLERNTLRLNLEGEFGAAPILVGMLLPAVQQARGAARRVASMNNTRQMALAFHNYQSAYGKFPQSSVDDQGRPLLSWRVHILPFIEQNELYEQFHLDEPWDSPHNRKLIDQMPPSFRSPSSPAPNGKTVYLGIGGETGIFNGKETDFADVTDGTSNTALIVEVNADRAVDWTRPVDYVPDPKKPLDGLGNTQPGGFIVALADGSTQFISNSINPEVWLKLMTMNGGEIVDYNEIR